MKQVRLIIITFIFIMFSGLSSAEDITAAVQQAMGSKHRDDANIARDNYRHPAETLAFFGLKPDMTVVDFCQGKGR